MKRIQLITILVLIFNTGITNANDINKAFFTEMETLNDSIRIAEINKYWVELTRTVKEGDFEGYKAAYHDDAIVVFTYDNNSASVKIMTALEGWKQGFIDTKSGKVKSDVKFRFSKRVGNNDTAHETGIFHYTSIDENGKELANLMIHFEMLLLKRNGSWIGMMEYQKSSATQEEWDSLEAFKG